MYLHLNQPLLPKLETRVLIEPPKFKRNFACEIQNVCIKKFLTIFFYTSPTELHLILQLGLELFCDSSAELLHGILSLSANLGLR